MADSIQNYIAAKKMSNWHEQVDMASDLKYKCDDCKRLRRWQDVTINIEHDDFGVPFVRSIICKNCGRKKNRSSRPVQQ